MNNNNQNLLDSINNTEIEQVLKNQKMYNALNILISMLSHIINIISIICNVISTNENNRNYSIVSAILSSVLTVILSSQQGLSQHIISNNKTLNGYLSTKM